MTTELTEETLILLKQVVPRTQRALYVLRISLCVVAAALAFAKLNLIPPLAAALALIITTFLIQARLRVGAQAALQAERQELA